MGDGEGGDVVTCQKRLSALQRGGGGPVLPVPPLFWGGQYAEEANCVKRTVMVDAFEKGEEEVSLGGCLPASADQGD